MLKKFFWVVAILSILCIAANVHADTVTDDFNVSHDYVADDVAGTIWDGLLINAGEYSAVAVLDVLDTDTNTGKLTYTATNTRWEWGDDNGALLYVLADGDFDMSVTLTDGNFISYSGAAMNYLSAGLMARDPNGSDQDYIYLRAFDRSEWSAVYQLGNNPTETIGHGADSVAEYPIMRLARVGDDFTAYVYDSTGSNEKEIASVTRTDLPSTLQVGIAHAIFSSNTGWVEFDDFELDYTVPPYAVNPSPEAGAEDVDYDVDLSWDAGAKTQATNGHKVYFSSTLSDVETSNPAVETVVSSPALDPGDLDMDTTYYWKVVEVNGVQEWEGPVWSFTTTVYKASNPTPPDAFTDVSEDVILHWSAGGGPVVSQDIYFGSNEALVAAGDISVLVGDGVSGSLETYDPTPGGELDIYTDYFWRVDSDAGSLGSVEGDVWSFTTGYPVKECDDFEIAHDYLSDGVAGTMWDGLLTTGLSVCNTDVNSGLLRMESANGSWEGNSQGALLYKEVHGGFSTSVHVAYSGGLDGTPWIGYNNPTLMVRIADVAAGGAGEDWVSVDFFNNWNIGIKPRTNDDGVRNDGIPGSGHANDAPPQYMRLDKDGADIRMYWSFDDVNWTPLYTTTRTDMEEASLQVGLSHCTFSGDTGWVLWDDFCIGREQFITASGPKPTNNGGLDLLSDSLIWTKGDYAVSHEVYFGTDYDSVEAANSLSPEYRGSANVVPFGEKFSYDVVGLEALTAGETYYWRVDEVNASHLDSPWVGTVWAFTVLDYSVVDDFGSYDETGTPTALLTLYENGALRKAWIDGLWTASWDDDFGFLVPYMDGSNGSLAVLSGTEMRMYFDNDGSCSYLPDIFDDAADAIYSAPCYSEVYVAVDDAARPDPTPADQVPGALGGYGGDIYEAEDTNSLECNFRDFTGYKILGLSFYGDVNNPEEQLYVVLEDGDGHVVKADYSGTIKLEAWQDWAISLADLSATEPDFDLDNVTLIYLGVGDRGSTSAVTMPDSSGFGSIWFDDIELYTTGVCVPDLAGVPAADLNDDCMVDAGDLEVLLGFWLLEGGGSVTASDDFGTAYDYLANGATGIWDGIIDDGNATVISSDGSTLTIDSNSSRWGPGLGNEQGVLLYKNVSGSFTATLKIVNVNDDTDGPFGSLMVRAANLADAGVGEDWFSLDFLPGWDQGSLGRAVDDGARIDRIGGSTLVMDLPHTFKMTYFAETGDFYCSYSIDDGVTYVPMTGGDETAYPYSRPDLAGVDLQVGIAHSTYNDGTENVAEFDDFDIAPATIPADMDLYPDNKVDFKDIAVIGESWMADPVLFGD